MTAIAKAEKILTPLTRTEWYLHEDGRIDRCEVEKFADGGEVSIGPLSPDPAPVGLTWTHVEDGRTIRVEEDYDAKDRIRALPVGTARLDAIAIAAADRFVSALLEGGYHPSAGATAYARGRQTLHYLRDRCITAT